MHGHMNVKLNIDIVSTLYSGAFAYPLLPWKHVDVAVNSIKVSSVAMEMQEYIQFARLPRHKIFRSAVNRSLC
jgi:hypothetical protein